MEAVEIINTNTKSVFCAGKEIPFDHPKVYLEIDIKEGSISCPYCNKKFVYNDENH